MYTGTSILLASNMSLLEVLPIELVERAISMFVRDVSFVEALRALNTCKTFRNLIVHHIVEKTPPREQFITRHSPDDQIVQCFLHDNLEILLKRRSGSQSTIEWVNKPLFDVFTSILKLEGCSIQDKRGKAFEKKLITYLGTLAKHWTIQRLAEDPLHLSHALHFPYRRHLKERTTVCTAIAIGNIGTVRKLFESGTIASWFFCETLHALYKYGYDRNFYEHVEFMHPILIAISTGDMEILRFLLAELFRYYDPDQRCESFRAFMILRLVIKTAKPQAIMVAHDQLIGYMNICCKSRYFCLIMLAATTGDITNFRTVVHLYATKPKCSRDNSTYANTCQDAHEDVIWSILKMALPYIGAVEVPLFGISREEIRNLVQFILNYYATNLLESAVPSHKSLVPVWKKKVPSKRDRVDRNPLLIEQAIIAVGSQTMSKTASYEAISKKEDHAMLACGAPTPPKY